MVRPYSDDLGLRDYWSDGQSSYKLMSLGQSELGGFISQLPAEVSHPVAKYGSKVKENDSKAEHTVVLCGVVIRSFYKTYPAVMNEETVGLTVQVAGGEAGCIEGFPEHIAVEADVFNKALAVQPFIEIHKLTDAALGVHVAVFCGDVHIGHTLDIEPQLLGGPEAVAKCHNGYHIQRRVDAEDFTSSLSVKVTQQLSRPRSLSFSTRSSMT